MSGGIITALLEQKFDVSKIEALGEDEDQYSPVTSIVHNGVNLTFQLLLWAKQSSEEKKRKGHMGLYIQYVSGPTDVLKMDVIVLAAKGQQQIPVQLVVKAEHEFTSKNKELHSGYGSPYELPNTLKDLKSKGYLTQNSMILHAFAILFIPESAFQDPSNKCPSLLAQNPFFQHLFGEIGTPVATNSPICNRVQLISNDGQRFWVHKDVLAFNSDAFKQMFDCDKPKGARFKYLREGQITLENVSGGAMREMLSYIYLKHTTPHFHQFAMELVPVAEMYELKGLHLLCVETLIVHTKTEKGITELLRMLDVSRLHKLSELEKVCVDSLKNVMNNENLTVTDILKVGAEAKKYDLNELLVACGQWFSHNWKTAKNSGQLDHVIEDKTGGLFSELMAFAAKK